ncbi:Histidine kinase [bacterium A37T11]|nr:Histidine kinase [bacterium A37T11]
MDTIFPYFRLHFHNKRGLLHLLFWLLVLVFYSFNYSRLVDGPAVWLFIAKDYMLVLCLFYSMSYLLSYTLYQLKLKGNAYRISGKGLLLGVIWLVLGYTVWAGSTAVICQVIRDYFPSDSKNVTYLSNLLLDEPFLYIYHWKKLPVLALDFIFLLSLPLAPKMVRLLLQQKVEKLQLKNKHLQDELEFHKMRVTPHFLLSTLNTIYLMMQTKDDKAPESMLKLSGILHYLLYESIDKKIPLQKELTFIQDYVDLMKLRIHPHVPITCQLDGGYTSFMVSPYLFVSLLENAFKHGPGRSLDGAWVRIGLQLLQDQLIFKIANGVNKDAVEPAFGGLGLYDLKRRLQFLYPGQHKLDIDKQPNRFQVTLYLNLQIV